MTGKKNKKKKPKRNNRKKRSTFIMTGWSVRAINVLGGSRMGQEKCDTRRTSTDAACLRHARDTL